MWPALLVLCTGGVFVAVAVPALYEWWRKTDVTPLEIDPARDGSADHFAAAFQRYVEARLPGVRLRRGVLDDGREEYAIVRSGADRGGGPGAADPVAFTPTAAEAATRATARVVVGEVALRLPDRFSFLKEIYGRADVHGGAGDRLRCVLSQGRLVLASGTLLTRWAHADCIDVGPGSRILGRLSARSCIHLSPRCCFTRLHARRIDFGAPASWADARPAPPVLLRRLPRPEVAADGRLLLGHDLTLPRGTRFDGDVVVRGDAILRADAVIAGSLKVHGTALLEPGACVRRSLVGRGDLRIGAGCTLGGPVLAEGTIEVGPGTSVGTAEAPTTLAAPFIRVSAGVVVHSSVWAREEGLCVVDS